MPGDAAGCGERKILDASSGTVWHNVIGEDASMASLFRRNRHEPVPAGAEVIERDGKQFARWRDDRGKSHEARLNPAGNKIVLPPAKEETYYIAFDDENGQRRTVKAYRDKNHRKRWRSALKMRRQSVRRA